MRLRVFASNAMRDAGSSFLPNNVQPEEASRLNEAVSSYHSHEISHDQCTNVLLQSVHAPLPVVWSIVRRFDRPQAYKCFIRTCVMRGDGRVGSMRDVTVVSGLPASCSTERLEILDDDKHVISFRVVGGEHRLKNYRSITTLHESQVAGRDATIVLESYVVDVPDGNSKEETSTLTDTVVRCNLQSLAKVSEHLALQQEEQNVTRATESMRLSRPGEDDELAADLDDHQHMER